MRSYLIILLVGFFCMLAMAAAPQKSILVSFEDPNTPDSVVEQAMDEIRKAGGMITHEYKLIKGFAAKASDKAIEAIHALGDKYLPIVEEDIVMNTAGNGR